MKNSAPAFPRFHPQIYYTHDGVTKSEVRLSKNYYTKIVRFYKGQQDIDKFQSERLRMRLYTWKVLLISKRETHEED